MMLKFPAWVPLLVLAIAGFAAYANSFQGAFVFDDQRHIVAADNIRRLWPISSWLLNNPRPVITLSLAINYALGGLNPWGYHVVNLGIHLCAAFVLFEIIRRTISKREPRQSTISHSAPWLALAIALLWAVHPLQTQSVTYIIQRSESLMGLFFLLCLLCFLIAVDGRVGWPWHAASILCYALAMGCKVAVVAAPLLVLAYDRLFVASCWRAILRARWLYYACMVAAGAAVLAGTNLFTSLLNGDPGYEVSVGFGVKGITPLQYLSSQPGVLVHYLRLVFWPNALCIDHEWPIPNQETQLASGILLPTIPMVGLFLGAVVACRKRPWLGFTGMWFFLLLAPSSSIVPMHDPVMEHRMYLPLAAVLAAVVIGAHHALNRALGPSRAASWTRRVVGFLLVFLSSTALMAKTYQRNKVYSSSVSIWKDVVTRYPTNDRGLNNLAMALAERGQITEAESDYRRAIEIRPDQINYRYNLAKTLVEAGRIEEGLAEYRRLLAQWPNDFPSRYNLANALYKQGRYEAAAAEYRIALTVQPNDYRVHFNLANALVQMGRRDEAGEHYYEVLKLKPDHAAARQAIERMPAQ